MKNKIKENIKEYILILIGVIVGITICIVCDGYVEKNSVGRPIIQLVESITRQDRYRAIGANLYLFIIGNITVNSTMKKESKWTKRALAYPVGVLLWITTSIVCLLLSVPYNAIVMGIILSAEMVLLCFLTKHKPDVEMLIRECGLFFVLVIILSSGIGRNIVGNDTTYYNENYGYWLVEEGELGTSLFVPMTMTGLATPSLCSYFKMWGVDNIYLAQNIFRCVFVVYFYKALEEVCVSKAKKKLAIWGTILLITAPAYSLVSSWIISNSFMMFEMLMLAVCLWKVAHMEKHYLWLATMLMFVVSFTRVEGAIIALFMVVCALPLNIKKKQTNIIILPSIIGQTIYQLMCLVFMKDFPLALFVSVDSIVILLAFMVVVVIFVQFIDCKWVEKFKAYLGYAILCLGVLGTLVLCMLDCDKYLYNLKMVLTNITYLGKTGSWGMLPLLFIICILLIIKQKKYYQYWDTMWIAYFVLILAICWSREIPLRVSIADSANRILIQMLPIFIMTLLLHIDKAFWREMNEKSD